MRTLGQIDFRLEWDRRLGIVYMWFGLQINRQNGIRHLAGDMRYIGVVPNLQPGAVFGQAVRDSAESWFRLPKPQLPRDRYRSRLVIFAPILGRGIAVSRDPAAVNENSLPPEAKRSQ